MSEMPDELEALRRGWAASAAELYESATDAVVQVLREDIYAANRPTDPYDRIRRACAIALGLADGKHYSLAARLLNQVVAEVRNREAGTGELGPLFVPLTLEGVAETRMNDLDGGVARIVYAAERSRDEPRSDWDTEWVQSYLSNEFEEWASGQFALSTNCPMWIKSPKPHVAKALELLGPKRFAALAAIRSLFRAYELRASFPSEYTRMRLLDAYRGLTVCIEALAKEIGRASQSTSSYFESKERLMLHDALKHLLGGSPFWLLAEDASAVGFDYRDPFASFSNAIKRIITGNNRTSLHLFLAQAVAATCLVRNFAAHEVTFGSALDDSDVDRAVGELTLAAFVYLPHMCVHTHHLESFCDD